MMVTCKPCFRRSVAFSIASRPYLGIGRERCRSWLRLGSFAPDMTLTVKSKREAGVGLIGVDDLPMRSLQGSRPIGTVAPSLPVGEGGVLVTKEIFFDRMLPDLAFPM